MDGPRLQRIDSGPPLRPHDFGERAQKREGPADLGNRLADGFLLVLCLDGDRGGSLIAILDDEDLDFPQLLSHR